MSTLLTRKFWEDAAERAIKTVAQSMVALLGAGAVGLLDVNWLAMLSTSGLAGLVSLLTSIGSAQLTNTDSASLTKEV